MTHEELIRRACRWLQNTAKCPVVLYEMSSGYEIPDAIGFKYGGRQSILIECKTSRSDFFRDFNKSFRRRPDFGVGRFRYYFVPPNLITIDELPEGWGLLECRHNVRVRKKSEEFEVNKTILWREMSLMFQALNRHSNNIQVIDNLLYGVRPLRGYIDGALEIMEDSSSLHPAPAIMNATPLQEGMKDGCDKENDTEEGGSKEGFGLGDGPGAAQCDRGNRTLADGSTEDSGEPQCPDQQQNRTDEQCGGGDSA